MFVVGLGKDLDPNVLRNISGDSNQVYVVPSVRGLSTVIRNVITDIGNDGKGNRSIYTKISRSFDPSGSIALHNYEC